jgi:redox-sensitive bicupin YhaK (pirin superfamily)
VKAGIQVIGPAQFARIDFAPFAPGLVSIESVGDSVELTKLGPFQWIHDAFYSPGSGIPHHPHENYEHLMLVVEGEMEHDDSRNGIHQRATAGDFIRMTNGTNGVVHSEQNPSDERLARVLMFVGTPDTDPPIEEPSYESLAADDAPPEVEADGVETRRLVGGTSEFTTHYSTLRAMDDIRLERDATLERELHPHRGLLIYGFTGEATLSDGSDDVELRTTTADREGPEAIAVIWTDDAAQRIRLTAGANGFHLLTGEWER